MSLAWWLNTAWMRTCQREGRAFRRATHTVAEAQQTVLRDLVAANCNTTFGGLHRFESIDSVDDYQCRVPLSTYDAYAPFIREIADGGNNILTSDRVQLLEPAVLRHR